MRSLPKDSSKVLLALGFYSFEGIFFFLEFRIFKVFLGFYLINEDFVDAQVLVYTLKLFLGVSKVDLFDLFGEF